jgi:hypothetical protein
MSASSLSPETLELCARGLGWGAGYIQQGSNADLAAACKAKLRERGLSYATSYLAHGEGRSSEANGFTGGAAVYEPFRGAFSANGETDDLALILAFSQAVAKGALP